MSFRRKSRELRLATNCLKSVVNYESILQRFAYCNNVCHVLPTRLGVSFQPGALPFPDYLVPGWIDNTRWYKGLSEIQEHTKQTIFWSLRDLDTNKRFARPSELRHLICFKQWTDRMVLNILLSALNLKCRMRDTHMKKMDILPNVKVMILQEVNEPILNMAVSKAASLLGAVDVGITDNLIWEHDYNGRIFSEMADIIFVSTKTHMCVQRFAQQSSVPVLCMMSRTHATIQSLATLMAIMEEYGTMQGLNISYVGPPHPVLNSYLLLCPMLGANIRFKCGCKECPVTPLLMDAGLAMTARTATECRQCLDCQDALLNACVVIAGPTCEKKERLHEFTLSVQEINKLTCFRWIFFHTCPRGNEVDDILFWNHNARTFNAFQNMHYIAAALMAYHVREYRF